MTSSPASSSDKISIVDENAFQERLNEAYRRGAYDYQKHIAMKQEQQNGMMPERVIDDLKSKMQNVLQNMNNITTKSNLKEIEDIDIINKRIKYVESLITKPSIVMKARMKGCSQEQEALKNFLLLSNSQSQIIGHAVQLHKLMDKLHICTRKSFINE